MFKIAIAIDTIDFTAMAISFTNKPWLTLLVLFCFLSLVRFSTADTPDWLKQFFFEDHENQDSVLSSTADQNNLNKDYCQCKVISSSRIVGGHTITNFIPWMLSVQLYGRHNCGGFIVNEKQFITAAHVRTCLTCLCDINMLYDIKKHVFKLFDIFF